mmetsp:Transcript_62192/g.196766  ORF Transcript_62192/g.196766 Transcript_62192/m.196766 type:complete len:322 (+) Transcript_62192:1650-2615(+)
MRSLPFRSAMVVVAVRSSASSRTTFLLAWRTSSPEAPGPRAISSSASRDTIRSFAPSTLASAAMFAASSSRTRSCSFRTLSRAAAGMETRASLLYSASAFSRSLILALARRAASVAAAAWRAIWSPPPDVAVETLEAVWGGTCRASRCCLACSSPALRSSCRTRSRSACRPPNISRDSWASCWAACVSWTLVLSSHAKDSFSATSSPRRLRSSSRCSATARSSSTSTSSALADSASRAVSRSLAASRSRLTSRASPASRSLASAPASPACPVTLGGALGGGCTRRAASSRDMLCSCPRSPSASRSRVAYASRACAASSTAQ